MIFALLKPLSSEYVPSGSVEQGGKEVSVHVFVYACVCVCSKDMCVCVHDYIYTSKRVSSSRLNCVSIPDCHKHVISKFNLKFLTLEAF